MPIPIENIYYLLSYAWDKLDEKDRVKVDLDDKTKLLDLLAKILINAGNILLKRGIDKGYIPVEEKIAGIKGKINLAETVKANLLRHQKAVCGFDEFSPNTLLNQVFATTLSRLRRTETLNEDLLQSIVKMRRMLGSIDEIELKATHFKQIRLNRNNRFYGFILDVCALIYESTLPSENKGEFLFADFTRDDHKMNQLFEAFIRNFYKIEQNRFTSVSGEIIKWKFSHESPMSLDYLPQMKTDITLENKTDKIIIDAKFYRETLTTNYEKEKIRSANLYQLFSYLLNQEQDNDLKTMNARGILLYPTIEKEYDLKYTYKAHKIEIRTLNLNANWQNISYRLKNIILYE